MKAFFKTLFGDVKNLVFVLGIVAIAALMTRFGAGREAAFIIPILIMTGATWFAAH